MRSIQERPNISGGNWPGLVGGEEARTNQWLDQVEIGAGSQEKFTIIVSKCTANCLIKRHIHNRGGFKRLIRHRLLTGQNIANTNAR